MGCTGGGTVRSQYSRLPRNYLSNILHPVIGLIQRVSCAHVDVQQKTIASIQQGICALIGVEKSDSPATADRLLERMLSYRIFADAEGKMNRSLVDVQGELLIVPQFTLPADTRKGTRPGFSKAASPELGRHLFEYLKEQARQKYGKVCSGQFGADMQLHLVNDGPVTFWLTT